MARLLLIISGGIAAYKSLELIRRVRQDGHTVIPVLTKAGAEFVTPLSVAALAGHKVYEDLFSLTDEAEMGHIRLARDVDAVAVVPASADILAKMAHGHASDLATTVLLATDKPVIVAPAMNPHMWAHPATQANVDTLRARGVGIISPDAGEMACGEEGVGRLALLDTLYEVISRRLSANPQPLRGLSALVTTGATWEPIDPVRFIGNRASGRQGFAIAEALAQAGARVTVVKGVTTASPPSGCTIVEAPTAAAMLEACQAAMPADIIVGAAAVADWRPVAQAAVKLKKGGGSPSLSLTENPDIIATLARHRQRARLIIGFALETDGDTTAAEAKRQRKRLDWLLLNTITSDNPALDSLDNQVTVLSDKGVDAWPKCPKTEIARRLVQAIIEEFKA